MKNPAPGILGGCPGGRAFVAVNGEAAFARRWVPVKFGDIVTIHNPGGGGAGDPLCRSPEEVRRDVLNDYVSVEAAQRDYGMALRDDLSIDWEQTRQMRG